MSEAAIFHLPTADFPTISEAEIKDKEDLTLQTPESFRKRFRIDVRIFHEAIKIDPERKTVRIQDKKSGEEYTEFYDKLILSPGAEPIRPPIPGTDSDRVFTLRNIPDTLKIKAYIEKAKPRSAVIVGGGYIGVEMAENLQKAGLDVTIAELSDHVMSAARLRYGGGCPPLSGRHRASVCSSGRPSAKSGTAGTRRSRSFWILRRFPPIWSFSAPASVPETGLRRRLRHHLRCARMYPYGPQDADEFSRHLCRRRCGTGPRFCNRRTGFHPARRSCR